MKLGLAGLAWESCTNAGNVQGKKLVPMKAKIVLFLRLSQQFKEDMRHLFEAHIKLKLRRSSKKTLALEIEIHVKRKDVRESGSLPDERSE